MEIPDTMIIIQPRIEDPTVQSLLDLRKGSKASRLESLKQKKQAVTREGLSNAHNKHYADLNTNSDAILYSLCSEESENETNDADDSDMDLSDDNLERDDDAVGLAYSYHDALNTQDAKPSFHKRSHDNQDPLNNRDRDNRKKIRNDVAVLTEAKWNSDEDEVSKPISFERHMSKYTKPHPSFYNNNFYYLVYLSMEEKHTTFITKHYVPKYYKQDSRVNFFKAKISTRTKGNVYSDLRIKLVARIMVKKKWGYDFLTSIVVRRFGEKEYEFSYADLPRYSLNDVEDMYLLQVQDKIHHLSLEFVKDFNNVLLLFIRRVIIQNRVEDIQFGVESYQQTLSLTKPMMFFEGIDERIPFTMTTTHKGIREILIDMVSKNKLGKGNKRLNVRDWIDNDVKKSYEMLDKTLKRREHLKRLVEYVGERPKTVNPYTFVRPV
nr:hypothetical protein [Tanacetum cinerariifolium]